MHTDISSNKVQPEEDLNQVTSAASKQRTYSTARDRLTPLGIKRLSTPGLYHDGGGLYLQVSLPKRKASGATGPEVNRSWVFRYRLQGKLRSMGIGSFHDVSLSEAREQIRKLRQIVSDKRDPMDERDGRARELALQRATEISFQECAEEYHRREAPKWKNAKHSAQWINTLTTYAFPKLGKMKVHNIGKSEVLAVLSPIWEIKPETASRVKQRMRAVLEWAASMDRYPNYNHGMWDVLNTGLGKGRTEDRKRKNHAACPIDQVTALIEALHRCESQPIVKLAFEFTVLTAARSGETRLMPWSEYTENDSLWKIPSERMKAKKEHRVPLSARCVEILTEAKEITGNKELVFCHPKTGKAFSDAVFTSLLHKGLDQPFTMHGFRSTFRDWGAEHTDHQRELLEVALAHLPGDQTEQAYWRSDMVQKRRKLMDDWARFVQFGANSRS
jgi:integrase